MIKFYHRCCYSPVISTWKAAIRKSLFATWPGLICATVDKYLDKIIATVKGHLRQVQQSVRSTQPPLVDEDHPHMEMKTKETYVKTKPVGTVYTDQTRKFPYVSSNASKYIMIMYDYDCNTIMSTPLRPKACLEQLSSLKKLHDNLRKQGQDTTVNFMDNEAPKCVTNYLVDSKISYQLVPPHVHRRNAAERAISTWKDHLISGLCTTDPSFPMHLWDRLLPQCDMTLNMMQTSRINLSLSAYHQLHGQYNYDATTMIPPGTKVVMHEKPKQRGSWDIHGED